MAKVKINKDRCKGCYLCIANCNNGCLKISLDMSAKGLKPVIFSGGKCSGCALCAMICPDNAIKVYR